MDWFRYHHGTPQDPKLTMLAKKIGVRRCEMTAVWDELMDYASRNVTRGHIDKIDLEVIAFTQEIPIENVKAIYDILVDSGRIINNILKAWQVRNPKREDSGATQRQREKRERDKAKKEVQKITHDHNMSRNVTTEERREEKKRLEKKERIPIPSTDLKTPPNPPNSEIPVSAFRIPPSAVPSPQSQVSAVGVGVLKNGNGSWNVKTHLSEEAIAKARSNAPGWDVYHLMDVYNQGVPSRGIPTNPNSAFPAWCTSYTKGIPPN